MNLHQILRAGRVTRWHTNPDLAHIRETNAEHQWMVAVIMLTIHPDGSGINGDLLKAALFHDCGEVIGDLPGPFKAARPDIADLHAKAEREARVAMGITYSLLDDEEPWLNLCDRLAAYIHVAHYRPELLGKDGWPEVRAWIVATAQTLGCAETAGRLLAESSIRADELAHAVGSRFAAGFMDCMRDIFNPLGKAQ